MELLEKLQACIEQCARQLNISPLGIYGTAATILSLLLFLLHHRMRIVKSAAGHLKSWTLERIQLMHSSTFEELVADLWQRLGYRTAVTPPGKDDGIDVIAERRRLVGLLGTERIAIQAKRYAADHKVDVKIVRECASIPLDSNNRYSTTIVVTSGGFTKSARDAARRFRTIKELVDGKKLIELLNEYLPGTGNKKAGGPRLYRVFLVILAGVILLSLASVVALLVHYVAKSW